MEGKLAMTLALLRNSLAILSSIAEKADLPAQAFLIGMAELEATQRWPKPNVRHSKKIVGFSEAVCRLASVSSSKVKE
jgi:hypothetical protein